MVNNGQRANETTFNNAFMSKTVDTSTLGKVDLNNTTYAVSGAVISNVQQHINDLHSNPKIFVRTTDDSPISWSAGVLTFTAAIEIRLPDNDFINTITAIQSPISLADGESVYVTLSRYANSSPVVAISDPVPVGKDIFRIATRVGTSLYLFNGFMMRDGASTVIGEGGGSGGAGIKVNYYDPVSVAVPTGPTAIIDGESVVNNDLVLFGFDSRIYKVTGVGTSMVWTPQSLYPNGLLPEDGDGVRVLAGDGFADQLAVYNGTDFKVNDKIRLFNETDYIEISAPFNVTIDDASTDTVFQIAYANSENIFVNYSVLRGTIKEVGTLLVTTNGTDATVSKLAGYVGDAGVSFEASITGSDILLEYTSTSTGQAGAMKYHLVRWSDGAGGPGGPPTYVSAGSSTAAAGNTTEIQFNTGDVLDADTYFTWNKTDKYLRLNGLEIVALQLASLINNVSSPTTIFSYPAATYRHVVIEGSVARNGGYRTYSPMVITNNGTAATIVENDSGPDDTGITFYAVVNGANIDVKYTSTNTGFNATFKYNIRRWS